MVSGQQPRLPAEWEPHAAVWTGWPSHAYAWGRHLAAAKVEATTFLRALLEAGGERVELLVADADAEAEARAALGPHDETRLRLWRLPHGDVWLRDTGPLFVARGDTVACVRFGFDGWGGKYVYPHDDTVGSAIAERAGLSCETRALVLEGGAIEVDGEGTCLTTESCLLDPRRNPGVTRADVERELGEALGVTRVIWLPRGLEGDHTDGHIDNVARFLAPGVVALQRPTGGDDPNRAVLADVEARLARASDARGRRLALVPLPSPGRYVGDDGVIPASYMNFYVANHGVLVPAYGREQDELARAALADRFAGRRVVSIPSRALLEGGGSLHCITQPQLAC